MLAPGYAAFAIFMVATTILNAAGRPRLALGIAAIQAGTSVGACWLLISLARSLADILLAAAVGATASMVVGALLAAFALRRSLAATLPLLSVARVVLAAAGAVLVGRILPHGTRLVTLGECVVVGLVYLVILLVTAELGRADLGRVRQVLRRKQARG